LIIGRGEATRSPRNERGGIVYESEN
jgi:hypothetical protein